MIDIENVKLEEDEMMKETYDLVAKKEMIIRQTEEIMQKKSIYAESYKPLFINEMSEEKVKEFSKVLSQKLRHVKLAISKSNLGQNKYANEMVNDSVYAQGNANNKKQNNSMQSARKQNDNKSKKRDKKSLKSSGSRKNSRHHKGLRRNETSNREGNDSKKRKRHMKNNSLSKSHRDSPMRSNYKDYKDHKDHKESPKKSYKTSPVKSYREVSSKKDKESLSTGRQGRHCSTNNNNNKNTSQGNRSKLNKSANSSMGGEGASVQLKPVKKKIFGMVRSTKKELTPDEIFDNCKFDLEEQIRDLRRPFERLAKKGKIKPIDPYLLSSSQNEPGFNPYSNYFGNGESYYPKASFQDLLDF